MTTLYKLTNEHGRTYGGCQWGPDIEHTASGEGELCGSGWLHAYESPTLAILLNPLHADFLQPKLWEAEGEIGKRDGQSKCGCTRLKTIREIPLPKVTTRQRVRFGILCAKRVYDAPKWNAWANRCLAATDRNREAADQELAAREAVWAARAAARAARAARAVAEAVAEAGEEEAGAAALSAEWAARAAARAWAEDWSGQAAWTAEDWSGSGSAAAQAAQAAVWSREDIDLMAIARQAVA